MSTRLVEQWGVPAVALAVDGPEGRVLRVSRRLQWGYLAALVIVAWITFGFLADRWLRVTTLQSRPATPIADAKLFRDPIAMSITVFAAQQRAPWVTTDDDLRASVELWKRMHFADWNGVPEPLRADGLDNMLRRYRHILNNPSAWDRMDAFDWDVVPQPVRTIAYRRMVAYWAGFYDVGAAFDLQAPVVAETLAAIVMSESWFDHRARSLNRDGRWDVGLGQASAFARQRIRELHASGRVDTSLSEDDYDNPWMATRFVALWMLLMLDEANGDLDMAVRAYNRGSGDAGDRLGADYLAAVQRRLTQYIRNVDAPPSWDHLWRQGRAVIVATDFTVLSGSGIEAAQRGATSPGTPPLPSPGPTNPNPQPGPTQPTPSPGPTNPIPPQR